MIPGMMVFWRKNQEQHQKEASVHDAVSEKERLESADLSSTN
jgi:hypothetical protein